MSGPEREGCVVFYLFEGCPSGVRPEIRVQVVRGPGK